MKDHGFVDVTFGGVQWGRQIGYILGDQHKNMFFDLRFIIKLKQH